MGPCVWIAEEHQGKALWLLFCAVLVVAWVLDAHKPPDGWLSLEFPRWLGLSAAPPNEWSTEQRETALFGLGLDFLFLLLYPLYLSLLCDRAGRYWSLPVWLAGACAVFSWLILAAGALDVVENIGLYWLIRGDDGAALQWSVTLVSALKWLIALTCLAVAGASLIHRGYARLLGPGRKHA